MTNAEMKKVLIKAAIFSLISISAMFYRSATKHIVISDAAGTSIEGGTGAEGYNLLVNRSVPKGKEGMLIIPLSKSVGSDDIVLEDRYMDHELLIYIDGREEDFYRGSPIKTDLNNIESAICRTGSDSGSVCLEFKLDGLYANESSLTENGNIEVRFFRPYDEYDKIVVVDSAMSGNDDGCVSGDLKEKDVAISLAQEIKSISEKSEDRSIKFYYTCLSDSAVDIEKRQALIKETKADLLVCLGSQLSEGSNLSGIRTTYNDCFFLRKLNNAQFADIMEKNCVAKSGMDAIGIDPCDESDVMLMDSVIPSCRVLAGVLDSEKDSRFLKDKNYRNRIAQGIYQGIVEAFGALRD